MAKKWTAVDFNLAKSLGGKVKVHRVELPETLQVQVVIELENELYDILSKNPTWLQRLQEKSKEMADEAVLDMAKAIEAVDAKAAKFNQQTADIFSKDLQSALEKRLKLAGVEMAKESEKLFEDFKKGKKELAKFRIKSASKIGLTALIVTAGAAASAATYGALSPLGIVAIVRGALTIVQEVGKLASTADQVGKLVKVEFAVLKKIMIEKLGEASKAGKIAQGSKEIGLNVLSKIVGLETPSLKNCRSHIELHKVDITKLEVKSASLSEKIYAIMDKQSDWQKKFDVAKKSMPAPKVGKIKTSLEAAEKALDTLLKSTIKVNEAVTEANERQEKFEDTINAMEEGLPGWIKKVDVVIGLAMDIGMAVADSSNAMEAGLNSLIAIESTILDEVRDGV